MVGLDLEDRPLGPLLPAPDQAGGWVQRSVTAAEAGAWLRLLLSQERRSAEGVSGHSLKSTTLPWASKFGLGRRVRLQLGHHSTGDGALNTYGRDFLAPALREYVQLLAAVRKRTFLPDLTRSGRVKTGTPSKNNGTLLMMRGRVLAKGSRVQDLPPTAPNLRMRLCQACGMLREGMKPSVVRLQSPKVHGSRVASCSAMSARRSSICRQREVRLKFFRVAVR